VLNDQHSLFISLFLAMCLKIAPFPHIIGRLNPDWILLMLIYWTLALPSQQGILNAWIIGLLTDVLVGCSLGEHALIYVLIVYTCIILHKRLRQFPMFQQMLFIFSCLFSAQVITFWLESINPSQLSPDFSISFWLSILTGTLIWPFINPALHFIRHIR
jgi:rod shape-determining protein MreD